MIKRYLYILFFFSLALIGNSQSCDVKLLQNLHTKHYTDFDTPFRLISNTTTLISLSIPAGLFVKGLIQDDSLSQRNAWIMSATYFLNGAITASLKYFVNRPRPFDSYPEYFIKKSDGGSPSFPSGHTSIAFATATSLSLLYPKWYVILPSYLWAGSVAYSRMHLGVHYPSDVLAGAAIGVATAYISYKANRWLNKRYGY